MSFINNMTDLTFKARFQANATILERGKVLRYHPKNVSIVKLDPYNLEDDKALVSISKKWSGFANSIKFDYKYNKFRDGFDVYAITLQEGKYNELNPEDVLGIMQISQNNTFYNNQLEYLQVNPKYINNKKIIFIRNINKFKHIGNAMLNFLKGERNNIRLHSVKSTEKFYEKNGFIPINKDGGYIWERGT